MGVREASEVSSLMTETAFETRLAEERAWLVRFCARLTGNPGAAEDLAQETLLEAWRNQHKLAAEDLVQPERRMKWLGAIARNVCLRWGRSHGRDLTHLAHYTLSAANEENVLDLDELPAGDDGLEVELERDELARLLDRALALLPPTTRAVLIERYIHESPHQEIAERLGLSEDALVQRLYRGKLALRKVMETELNAEAAAYGLVDAQDGTELLEMETRITCPMCNQATLVKHFDPASGRISFNCPICWTIASPSPSQLWGGLHSPKSILKRQLAYLGKLYWQAINHGENTCPACGRQTRARILTAPDMPVIHRQHSSGDKHAISIRCDYCQAEDINPLSRLTIDVLEAQQFWRQHPHMFWLPEREISYAGQPALLSGFQSAADSARLDIVYEHETLKILGIHETRDSHNIF